MGTIREFFKNIENYKIYNLILVATVAFIIMLVSSFFNIRNEIKYLADKNRELTVKDIRYIIESWIFERMNSLEISAKYLNEYYESEKSVQDFLSIYLKGNKYFDAVQLLIPDKYFYVNDKKMDDYIEGYTYGYGEKHYYKNGESKWYLDKEWFQSTKRELKTTIEKMDIHEFLLEPTFNICTPVLKDEKFIGVFCGIIKANLLFDKIKALSVPDNIYYFMGKDGNIVAQGGGNQDELNEKLVKIRSRKLSDGSYTTPSEMHIDGDIVSMDKIADFDWYIAVGINWEKIENEIIKYFLNNAITVLLYFVIFVVIVNTSYTFLYTRAEAKKREYKKMLEYNSRMSEVGSLVSAINHQLRQPLNALALIISNSLLLLKNIKSSEIKNIKDNLKLSQRSIAMMDKTINIYRNFYRSSDNISEFELLECVENVLYVTHIDLMHNNIVMNIDKSAIEGLKIHSSENFIQQILLVLIQNAKDAISAIPVNKNELESRKIEIKFDTDDENVTIFIADYGSGIIETAVKRLFSPLSRSHKPNGFGMGLFFAKKLAKEKLMGNLELIRNSKPTIFALKIKKDIRENR
ncbi:MAG: sensor histidine kinase [Campylobacteraceae bacterium]|nr:sensor histidine kinase [Campylobacteraceae bacterium]